VHQWRALGLIERDLAGLYVALRRWERGANPNAESGQAVLLFQEMEIGDWAALKPYLLFTNHHSLNFSQRNVNGK